ncbi:MAG: BRCT domain-containing protein, partial [Planctomycetota bacterium]
LDQHLADLAQWQALVRMSAETAAARLKDSKQDNLANYSEFMIGSRNQALSNLDQTKTRLEQTRKAADKTVDDLAKNIRTMRDNINRTFASVYQTEDKVEQTRKTLGNALTKERQAASEADRALKAFQDEFEKRSGVMERGLTALNDKIARVDSELNPPPRPVTEADGRIESADPATGIVTINLGVIDRVRRGMVFKVFRTDRAGAMVEKGKIRVTEVSGPRLSAAGTIEITDLAYPFVAGDMIEAPNFPEVKKFVLVGAFPEDKGYSRAEIEGMIADYGGIVVDEVDVDTDFIIVGDLSEKRPEWTEKIVGAREYRVRILRVPQLVDYIGPYIRYLH